MGVGGATICRVLLLAMFFLRPLRQGAAACRLTISGLDAGLWRGALTRHYRALAQIAGIRSAPSIDLTRPCRKGSAGDFSVPAGLVRPVSCALAAGAPVRATGSRPARW